MRRGTPNQMRIERRLAANRSLEGILGNPQGRRDQPPKRAEHRLRISTQVANAHRPASSPVSEILRKNCPKDITASVSGKAKGRVPSLQK